MNNFTDTVPARNTTTIRDDDRGAYYAYKAEEFAAGLPPAERLRREENGRTPNVRSEFVPMNTNQSFA